MKLLLFLSVLTLAICAGAQEQQQEKLAVIKSECHGSSWYGYTAECIANAYTMTNSARTAYMLMCGMKDKDTNACANLVAKDVWPFMYIADGKYCTAHTIKGQDGKDYPVKCIKLSSKQELIYTFVKDDDYWCSQAVSFCKK